MKSQKRILYCPLNWGLGHASRGIYLIHKLLEKNHTVIIAADGEPLSLLKKEFPELESIRFPSLRIRYTRRIPLMLKMLYYLPSLMIGITREHYRVEKLIKEYKIDIVVSDNRYGLWSRQIPSVLITHQISILLPTWLSWFEYALYRTICHRIKKFNYLWIPDSPGENNLSGDLSRKYPLPGNAVFIGFLSRFMMDLNDAGNLPDEKYDILVILSGPEPQRSVLEQKIYCQLQSHPLKTLVIRGLPSEKQAYTQEGNLVSVSHLPSLQLRSLMLHSRIIVARSGYSTIMDLMVLGKRAILIPTPGQPEQEYLGKRMEQMMGFPCVQQKNFDLKNIVADWSIQDDLPQSVTGFLEKAIEDVVADLHNNNSGNQQHT